MVSSINPKILSRYAAALIALFLGLWVSLSEYSMRQASENSQFRVIHATRGVVNLDLPDNDFLAAQGKNITLPHRQTHVPSALWLNVPIPSAWLHNGGVFIPRITDKLEIWHEGKMLLRLGERNSHYKRGKHPIIYRLNLDTPSPTAVESTLWLRIEPNKYKELGISEIYIGEEDPILDFYQRHWFNEIGTGIIGVSASIVLGFLGFLLGIRSDNKALLWFSAAAIGWLLRGLPNFWLEGDEHSATIHLFSDVGYGIYVIFIQLFVINHLSLKSKFFRIFIFLEALTGLILVPVAHYTEIPNINLLSLWFAQMLSTTAFISPFALWEIKKRKKGSDIALGAAIALSLIFGIHDFLMIQASSHGFGDVSLVRFSEFVFLISIFMILLENIHRTYLLEKNLNKELQMRVQQREADLEQIFNKKTVLENQATLRAERERITQNIHDGLGMHLNAIRLSLQNEKTDKAALTSMLESSIDQLRLAVDAISPIETTALGVLANLRHRLSGRFESQGITLHWHMDRNMPEVQMSESATIHLQYFLYEVFGNILQHARAKNIYFRYVIEPVGPLPQSIEIRDDGVGFDTHSASVGRGLRGLLYRAQQMGALLAVDSNPSGTTIRLRL